MALDDLVTQIELLRSRIAAHRNTLAENETRTRISLIDPLLHALGWDVADPAKVAIEYGMSGGVADYALLQSEGKPVAIVEAKRLGTFLSSHRQQIVQYAVTSGIGYAVLTNGDDWEFYDVFQRRPLEEKRTLEISIAKAKVQECALKLLLLWQPNLSSGQPVTANAPILNEPVIPPEPKPVIIEPQPNPDGWVALSEYNPSAGTKCPMTIRFWDKSERNLNYWNEVLTLVVEHLYTTKLLQASDTPIPSRPGSKNCLIHTEPRHPDGTKMAYFRRIDGTPLFVNTHLNAMQIREYTKQLLLRYKQNPSEVWLRVT